MARLATQLATQLATALLLGLMFFGCRDRSSTSPPVSVPRPVAATNTSRPWIVLDESTRGLLREAAQSNSSAWKAVAHRCKIFSSAEKSAGYLGLQWGEAVASLSLCWHATGDPEYAAWAVRYLTALLNDRERIGDGRGGDQEVRRNSGYPIRAHGVWAALGYDWLYHAPTMNKALRQTIDSRLKAWLSWYQKDGYLRDTPSANYFWGYFTTLTMAGIALDDDSNAANGWLQKSLAMLKEKIIPVFSEKLSGGAWPEGWQYGPLVSVSLAMIIRAYATAREIDFVPRFPWFGELARSHLHRLHPDEKAVYGNGTHAKKPVRPTATPLQAAVFTLAKSAPEQAAEAQFVAALSGKSRKRATYPWFNLLASLSGNQEHDFRTTEPLSYHLKGPGLTFARSSWTKNAVWTSFQAGPKIAVDHQNHDQGHFEIWRGGDGLFIDGGASHAAATSNHNSLLVDDGGRALNYPPNQGVWAIDSKTVGYVDDGRVVAVVGDIGGAWDPKCAKQGCSKRAVDSVIRTFVFIRPDVVVIDDKILLRKGSDDVRWAAHTRVPPLLASRSSSASITSASIQAASVTVGSSRLDLNVLAPSSVSLTVVKEPTPSDDHVYKKNDPLGDVWRIEVPSPRGTQERHFRVWMRASAADAPGSSVVGNASFASGRAGNRPAVILFANGNQAQGTAKPNAVVAVVGLDSNRPASVTVVSRAVSTTASKTNSSAVNEETLCMVNVLSKKSAASPTTSEITTSSIGTLSFTLNDACQIQR